MLYDFYIVTWQERVGGESFDTEAAMRDYADYLAEDWHDKVFAYECGDKDVIYTAEPKERS